jgi:hypothetical protein
VRLVRNIAVQRRSRVVFIMAERLDASNLLSDVLLRRGICYIHYGDIEPAITDLDMVIQLDNPKFQALVRALVSCGLAAGPSRLASIHDTDTALILLGVPRTHTGSSL